MRRHASGVALLGNRWDVLDGQRPDDLPSISVVVAHYRQQRELDRTLHALLAQDYPAELLEIIVVDDGSPEPPEVPDRVRLALQDDKGFRLAAARNRGAALAQNEIICFLDADTTPERGYVRALTRLPALAPDCVTVGRRLHTALSGIPVDTDIRVEGPRHQLGDPAWLRAGYQTTRNLLKADERSYRYMIGAVTACRREFFEVVGGYDESFTQYGGEDWEWAYRAWLAGAVFAHVPEAVAWHDGPDWSDRGVDDRQLRKNAEALRLAELIPIAGSRGQGIRPSHADILLQFDADRWSPATCFVCVDSALADVPEASLDSSAGRVALCPATLVDRVRIRIRFHRPVRVGRGALRSVLDRVTKDQLGRLTVVNAAGTPLVEVISTRAASRQARWNDHTLFESQTEENAAFTPIQVEPDLEGYFGGWS